MTCIFKWDAWDAYWPWFHYFVISLKSGRWPLWDPGPNCGFPFHAELNTSLYYPVSIVTGLLFGGGYKVFQLLWLGHWLSGMLGLFFLLKRFGMSPLAAIAGATIFGFNGFFIGNAEHTTCIVAMSYFPWILLLLDYSNRNTFLYPCTAGLLTGFSALGGNPVITIYMVPMICLWSLLRLRPISMVVRTLFITFLVAGIILSPSYVSFLVEGRDFTDRVDLLPIVEALDHDRFSWDALVSLIAPALIAKYSHYFQNQELTMINGYFGVFGVLSVIGVSLNRELRQRWKWVLVFIVVAFLLSLGTSGLIGIPAYYIIPALRFGRHTALFKAFWMFGGAVLAGAYFDSLTCSEKSKGTTLLGSSEKILLATFLAVIALLTWAWLVPDTYLVRSAIPIPREPNTFWTAFVCTSYSLVTVALFWFSVQLFKTQLSQRLLVGFLLLIIIGDAAAYKISSQESICWGSRAFKQIQAIEHEAQSKSLTAPDPNGVRNTDPNFSGNYWAFDGKSYCRAYLPMTNRSYETLVGNSLPPYEYSRFLEVLKTAPRFWLVPEAAFAKETDTAALTTLKSTGMNDPVPLFIHDAQASGILDEQKVTHGVRPGSYGSVRVLLYEHEKIRLKVTAPDDCWLFATERYNGSWKSFVDDEPQKLFKANFCFRALRVSAGEHVIEMTYSPWAYLPLLFLSWGLSLIIIAVWIYAGVVKILQALSPRPAIEHDFP
ncbi:YfhO family protein [Desulfomonile tiedjei]|uniref:Bacterial membrane protein YfhO n=1 Tax=Desulfomonile tiedjei (strain ATCC 49306 / DSM 6799 / DCB-1) TaxID=706587 RepID=I4C840_DESTA|nr:YfhO family protein [Desulfomonile tiedjei]AFM25731.1 Bacterial membrane protein YfhO [Desulfomonile tiedjei DSM 6799]